MAEIYCDICHNHINDCDEYKVIDRIIHEHDDEFIRICKPCEIEDGA
tara:strand:+ start:53 stop:193 length:141 start_codon:yes stop_codon:yes gene_type:complete